MENLVHAPPNYSELGRKLFAQRCAFLWAAADAAQVPNAVAPEIAFAGRSNVGKSTLLNALTSRRSLARVSRTPGRTRALNFFALGPNFETPELCLVDMPGYGYAAASKALAASWARLASDFLRCREALLRVMLLIDGRHGAKTADVKTMNLLDQAAVSYQIVLTKKDEVNAIDREARLAAAYALIAKHPAAFPEPIFTSSHSGDGIGDLRAAIAKLLLERGR
jgi:GTP-binding protein